MLSLCNFAWVAVGGAVGSALRFWLSLQLNGQQARWPWATIIANLAAALVLGALFTLLRERPEASPAWRLFIATGFCGGFSTFSTFSLELWQMIGQQQHLAAIAYAAASLFGSLVALGAGGWLMRQVL